jgi:CheY-like chemotaxis protein
MKRILVADDSVTIQKVIALTFADEPFEVQSVGTGAEALELVKSWKPDIVLADVIMPQMNGYELCRAVKQQEETRSVPVLLLAGTFEAFDEEEAKSVGANDFITKPFESGELIEKVKKLIGGMPATSPAEAAPAAADLAPAAGPGAAPEVVPQADTPVSVPAGAASEPDIWDILSDTGDDATAQTTGGGAPAPGFGPIEDTGVVDVGSFDVGIGRPESPTPTAQPPAAAPPETVQMPEVVESTPAPQVQPAPAAPPVTDQIQDMEERSRVENMEKDFFGFETGAVEEVPATDFLDDAVEEVTFEMEQPQAAPEVDAQEVSFVVPEPAGDQAVITGETISPDIMAPEPLPVPEPAPEPMPAPDPAPEPVPAPAPEPVPAPQPPVDLTPQPEPEPPLELPVDLIPELPDEISPEPFVEPTVAVSAPRSPEQAMDVPDDAAIRKLVEERVEKIAWEVVPEMAEVIIREAIQKIKDGS